MYLPLIYILKVAILHENPVQFTNCKSVFPLLFDMNHYQSLESITYWLNVLIWESKLCPRVKKNLRILDVSN